MPLLGGVACDAGSLPLTARVERVVTVEEHDADLDSDEAPLLDIDFTPRQQARLL